MVQPFFQKVKRGRNFLFLMVGIFLAVAVLPAVGIMIYDFGFPHGEQSSGLIDLFYRSYFNWIKFALLLRLALRLTYWEKWRSLLADGFLVTWFWLCDALVFESGSSAIGLNLMPGELLSSILIYASITAHLLIEAGRLSLLIGRLKLNPGHLLLGSYLFLVIIGTGLLLLPNATTAGISFTDALFTATSAVCVNGLIVVDTNAAFTQTGKGILLLLFQLGGLGILTFTSFFGLFFSGQNSFSGHFLVKDLASFERSGDLFRTLLKVVFITLLAETIGALLIYQGLSGQAIEGHHPFWFSVFHSVSAYCNAGFSLLSEGMAHESIRFNYLIVLTLAWLIITGSLGFPIVFNFYRLGKHYLWNLIRQVLGRQPVHRPGVINLSNSLALVTTVLLLLVGTLFIFLTERNAAHQDLNAGQQLLTAFFSSATTRSGGLNTIDFNIYGNATVALMIFLMWVGGSPSSTGGGIKTTTFAVASMAMWSFIRGKMNVETAHRRLGSSTVIRAFALIFVSILAISAGMFLLAWMEPDLSFRAAFFEVVSAYCTVGASLGATSELGNPAKILIVVLMLAGRIGLLSLLLALVPNYPDRNYRYPEEDLLIN